MFPFPDYSVLMFLVFSIFLIVSLGFFLSNGLLLKYLPNLMTANLNMPFKLSFKIYWISLAAYPLIFLLHGYFSTMWLYYTADGNDVSLLFQKIEEIPSFVFSLSIVSFFVYLNYLPKTNNRAIKLVMLTISSILIWIIINFLIQRILMTL